MSITKIAAQKPQSKQSLQVLVDLLACLRALEDLHQTVHWSVSCNNFYGDHLLFERLYENMGDEVDQLAEKLVDYFHEDAVDINSQYSRMADFAKQWTGVSNCHIEQAIVAEKNLQDIIEHAYDIITQSQEMSLGLDDFLMALANDHETHHYLISQNAECGCDDHRAAQKMQ